MKKTKGFTLIELMIAIGILGIISIIVGKVSLDTSKAHNALLEITKIDMQLGKTVDIFKRTIRQAKIITTGSAVSTIGSSFIVARVPAENTEQTEYIDNDVAFIFQDNNLYVNIKKDGSYLNSNGEFIKIPDIDGADILATNVRTCSFIYNAAEHVSLIDIVIDSKDHEISRRIRDSAVTRIGYNFD